MSRLSPTKNGRVNRGEQVSLPAGLLSALAGATAASILEHYDLGGLRRVAEGRNIALPDFLLRHQVSAALEPLLFAGGSLLSALSRLSQAEWDALSMLVEWGPLKAGEALERLGQQGAAKPAGVLLGLVSKGLVLVVPRTFGQGSLSGGAGGDDRHVRLEGRGDELLFVPEPITAFFHDAHLAGRKPGVGDLVLPGREPGKGAEQAGPELNLAGAFGYFVRSMLALLHRIRGGEHQALARELEDERATPTRVGFGGMSPLAGGASTAESGRKGGAGGGVTLRSEEDLHPGSHRDSIPLGLGPTLVMLQGLGIVVDGVGTAGDQLSLSKYLSTGEGVSEYDREPVNLAGLQVNLESAADFAALPQADQVRAFYRVWKGHCEPPSVLELDDIRLVLGGEGGVTPENYLLKLARDRVGEALVFCSPFTWTSVSLFVEFLLARHPDFIYPFPGDWVEPVYPGIEWGRAMTLKGKKIRRTPDHRPVEELFIKAILSQLESLGLVVMAGDRREFRPTREGLYALGIGRKPLEQGHRERGGTGGGGFIVQPTFEVLVLPERASMASLFTIGRFAEAVGFGPAPTYLITRDSIYEGICGGLRAPDIVEFLESKSDFPLPQNVGFSVLDWGESFDRLQFLPGCTVIDFDDEAEAEDVLRHGSGLPEDSFWASPVRLVLPLTDRREIARVLGQNLPVEMDYGPDGGLPPCLVVNGDLSVTVQMDRLNFKAEQVLNRIGIHVGEGVWRLTPQSLRKSRPKWRMDQGAIRAALLEATAHRLPPELDVALEAALAHEPGQVLVGRPLVVFTHTPAQLDTLFASQSLSCHLEARIGPCSALVSPSGYEQFRERLVQLGVEVAPVDVDGDGVCGSGELALVARETEEDVAGRGETDKGGFTVNSASPVSVEQVSGDPGSGHGAALDQSARSADMTPAAGSEGDGGGGEEPRVRMDVKQLIRLFNQALNDTRDLNILYDPGSRKPLESLKVTPLSLEEGRSATYLSAVSPGSGGGSRKFSLNFIHSADFADQGEGE